MNETSDAILAANERIYAPKKQLLKEGNIIVFMDVESARDFYRGCPVGIIGLLNIDDCRIILEDEEKTNVYHPAFRICDIYQGYYKGMVEKYAVKSLYIIQRKEGK